MTPDPVPTTESGRRMNERAEDKKTYNVEWSALSVGILLWAQSFAFRMAKMTWAQMQTTEFIFTTAGELIGVVLTVVASNKIPSGRLPGARE